MARMPILRRAGGESFIAFETDASYKEWWLD